MAKRSRETLKSSYRLCLFPLQRWQYRVKIAVTTKTNIYCFLSASHGKPLCEVVTNFTHSATKEPEVQIGGVI